MSEITKAMQMLCDEKNLSYEIVIETVEAALAAAYRKDFGNKQQNIKVHFDPETGDLKAWDVKIVVKDIDLDVLEKAQEELSERREKAREENRELEEEEIADLPHFNPKLEMMLTEAKAIEKKSKLEDVLEIPLEVSNEFGRMAAQTAKQVIIQKLREAERNMVYESFKDQEGQIVVGTIQRVEGRKVLVDLGKITAVLPAEQQIPREFYRPGSRMKFFIEAVNMSARGPEIVLSRSSIRLIEEIFRQEIPEINDEIIEIKGISRDAGFRAKVSVYTDDSSVDPIGSCIGQRGARINVIIEELGGEKIDIIKYSDDPSLYISNALSPAKTIRVDINEELNEAEVYVEPDQFSLAIGRSGQNVRLASELTGWTIKVKEEGGEQEMSSKDESDDDGVKTNDEEKSEDNMDDKKTEEDKDEDIKEDVEDEKETPEEKEEEKTEEKEEKQEEEQEEEKTEEKEEEENKTEKK